MGIIKDLFRLKFLGKEISAQNPVPTDGDTVYEKDIDVSRSIIGNFSGSVTDVFNNLHTEISDNTANNPKLLTVHFNRTIPTLLIGLGSSEGGTFSNTKIIGILSGGVETVLSDYTNDSNNYPTFPFQFTNSGLNAVRFEFHTVNKVSLTNVFIPKLRIISSTPETPVIYADAYNGVFLKNGASEDMVVDGTLGSPIDFKYTLVGLARGLWHRSFIELTDGNQDFISSNFGAIVGGLTNGVQIIVVRNGFEKVLETWKSNMDISLTMFDFRSPYRQGEYVGRWTIPSDIGGPITLFEGDEIILRVRDLLDTLALDSFRFKIKIKQ